MTAPLERTASTPRGRRLLRVAPPIAAAMLTSAMLVILDELPLYVDGPSYLAIAQHWADGNWSAAVNGYWSPLLSFVLVPAALAEISLPLAAAVVSVLTAAAAVAAMQYLLARSAADPVIAATLAFGACPFVAFAALDNLTPDLLMAVFLLLFVAELIADRVAHPIRTGVFGGLAFLAKTYALPFMIAFVVVITVERVVRSRSQARRTGATRTRRGNVQPARPVLVAAAVMLVIAALWSVVISVDEGRLTYSTAAGYNTAITAPGARGVSFSGLTEPDHPAAHWAWEDPAALPEAWDGDSSGTGERSSAERSPAEPLDQGSALSRLGDRAERMLDNVERTVRASALVAGSAVAALAVSIWFAASVVHNRSIPAGARVVSRRRAATIRLAVGVAIYCGGLLWLIAQPRYLYFAMLAMVAITVLGLSELAELRPDQRQRIVAVALVLAVATAIRPAVALVRMDDRVEAIHELEEFLDTVDVSGDRVASYPAQLHVVGARCLVEDCVYLGAPRVGSDENVPAQLDAFDVDVFIVRDGRRIEIPAGAELAARSDELGYSIFELSNPAG